VDNTSKLASQKIVAAEICRMMAQHSAAQNHLQEATKFYKEALSHQPQDPDTLISLAKLYLQVLNLYDNLNSNICYSFYALFLQQPFLRMVFRNQYCGHRNSR
jgi:hypothetical protein